MVAGWEVIFYQNPSGDFPVEDFIGSLTAKEQAKVSRSIDLLEEFGLALGMPHVKKIGVGMWELRVIFGGQIFRLLFTTLDKGRIVLLHGFVKKSDKIPLRELEVAKQRQGGIK